LSRQISDEGLSRVKMVRCVRHIKSLFEGADIAICVSFHAAIFASNAGVTIVCVYGDEYYRRKFSALKNAHLVDVCHTS
jgi:polysaccharide pyruvyl transferase WcaK-like protein